MQDESEPYEQSEPDAELGADRATIQWVPLRPFGISVLCILHGIGGLLFLFVVAKTLATPGRQADIQNVLGIAGLGYVELILSAAILIVTSLGSAVGMCTGRTWGWWLGSFYYANSLFRYGTVLIMAFMLSESAQADFAPSRFYSRYVARILVNSLILLYFFRGNVLEYFQLKHRNRSRLLWDLIAVNIGISATMAFL